MLIGRVHLQDCLESISSEVDFPFCTSKVGLVLTLKALVIGTCSKPKTIANLVNVTLRAKAFSLLVYEKRRNNHSKET